MGKGNKKKDNSHETFEKFRPKKKGCKKEKFDKNKPWKK